MRHYRFQSLEDNENKSHCLHFFQWTLCVAIQMYVISEDKRNNLWKVRRALPQLFSLVKLPGPALLSDFRCAMFVLNK